MKACFDLYPISPRGNVTSISNIKASFAVSLCSHEKDHLRDKSNPERRDDAQQILAMP